MAEELASARLMAEIAESKLASVSALNEKLELYNQLLKRQVARLNDEVAGLADTIRAEPDRHCVSTQTEDRSVPMETQTCDLDLMPSELNISDTTAATTSQGTSLETLLESFTYMETYDQYYCFTRKMYYNPKDGRFFDLKYKAYYVWDVEHSTFRFREYDQTMICCNCIVKEERGIAGVCLNEIVDSICAAEKYTTAEERFVGELLQDCIAQVSDAATVLDYIVEDTVSAETSLDSLVDVTISLESDDDDCVVVSESSESPSPCLCTCHQPILIDEEDLRPPAPSLRCVVSRSQVAGVDLGTLFVVTRDGSHFGSRPAFAANVSHFHYIKVVPEILFKITYKVPSDSAYRIGSYAITIMKGSYGSMILNSKTLTTGGCYFIKQNDRLIVAGVSLVLHAHQGDITCDGCATWTYTPQAVVQQPIAALPHRVQLKQMKRNWGIHNEPYEQKSVNGHGKYADRAAGRRETVGSDGPVVLREVTTQSEIPANNLGRQLLSKMGWRDGEGLGREGQGRVEPVTVEQRGQTVGLGHVSSYDPQTRGYQNRQKARKRYEELKPSHWVKEDEDDDCIVLD